MDMKMFVVLYLTVAYIFFRCDALTIPGSGRKINIAQGKPAEQGPYTYSDPINWKQRFTHAAGLAVNGNTSQEVDHGQCSHTYDNVYNTMAWWKVDFMKSYYLSEVKIFNRKDKFKYRLQGFTVLGISSRNGIETNQTIYNDAIQMHQSYNNNTITLQVPDKATPFSGILIYIPGHTGKISYLVLCEVQVFIATNCTVPSLANGNISWGHGRNVSSVVPEGVNLNFRCNTGYNLNTQSQLTCQANGLFLIGGNPQCTAQDCGLPNAHPRLHGKWSSAFGYRNCLHYKCIQRLQCNTGYSSTEDIVIACNSSGKWTSPNGTCTLKTCGKKPHYQELSHGAWSGASDTTDCFVYGCQYEYVCHRGYRPTTSLNITTRCDETGNWSKTPGHCTAIPCKGHFPILRNGTWLPLNGTCFHFQCRHIFECDRGFTSQRVIETSCGDTGVWTKPDVACEEITCSAPKSISSGEYYIGPAHSKDDKVQRHSDSKFSIDTMLTFKCDGGFLLKKDDVFNRTCLVNGSWSEKDPECIVVDELNSEPSTSSNSAVIGGSVGAVIAIIIAALVVLGFVILRRKRLHSNKYASSHRKTGAVDSDGQNMYSNIAVPYEHAKPSQSTHGSEYSCIEEIENTESQSSVSNQQSSEISEMCNETDEAYYNITTMERRSPTAIMLKDLVELVLTGRSMKQKLEEQFDRFPVGLTRSHEIALKRQNQKKNRYRQIYAYDDTRVILKNANVITGGDYINATYIHGYDKARAFIASQGPTNDMVNDFWKMLWQEDCGKIVMLTNLKEEKKMKCIQYWPNQGSQAFGGVTVTLKDTEKYSDFIIRTLAIKQASDKQKIVRQFHFTGWPDRGVPTFASSIVNFRNKVKNTKSYCNGPTVVHCSAGIGRTGTYIALDILTDQGNSLGYIDVAACVDALRRQRVNMVQNLDQYIFLHSALTEALMLSSSAIPASAFPQTYQELLEVDPVKRRRNIEIKFDMLKHMSPVVDEQQYVSAREVRNKKRNRYSNILPVSEFMPTITGSTKDGYINAVYLPSYKEKRAMILTQMPLDNTKDDFWALIQEHNVHTVVMLNNLTETEKDEIYWPEVGESQTYNSYDIESLGEETIGQHSVVTLHLSHEHTERTVKQIQSRYWPAHQSLPNSPMDIIETIELVQKLQQQSGNHPVVVHCMNGVDRSGLFCVISAVIERLKIEQDVAITQIIEQMRCCRDQIIPSCEQFQFCHDVILAYIQQFTEYSNFSSL